MNKSIECIFCRISPNDILASNSTMLAFKDKFPVTNGHILIIPKKHRQDFFELNGDETQDAFALLSRMRQSLFDNDKTISGFNIGANCGESAGQTVFHCHIHLIPRRDGDCEDPKGGVRGVIAERQKYESN